MLSATRVNEARRKAKRTARLLAIRRRAFEGLVLFWLAGSLWHCLAGRWDAMLWGLVSAAASIAFCAVAEG
ncbi:hypothetical protein ABTC22_18710, partial [Acinetobacter baumannii]